MVLIIDDEDALRDVIQEILELADLESLSAANGMEALKLFESHRSAISVVLLDMQMPTMTGAEVLAALRKQDARLKIIVMSGYPQSTLTQFAKDPALYFLQKPFTLEKLQTKVRSVIEDGN